MYLGLDLGLSRRRGGGTPAPAFHIYVDSREGDDENDGTSAGAPLRTLSAAQTAATSHGNGVKIGFKYGSEWRESLTLHALDGITLAAYGTKEDGLPVFRADDVITGEWNDSTDRSDELSNTYSISWTHIIEPGNTQNGPNVWVDGVLLAWQDSATDVDANPGSFYHDGESSDESPVTLYVHPPGSTDPNSDGKTYEATRRNWVIRAGNSATLKHLWAKRAGADNGNFYALLDADLYGCLTEDGIEHAALINSGVFRYVVNWRQTGGSSSGFQLEAFVPNGVGKSVLWDHCISKAPCPAFGGHTDGVNFYDSWIMRDCAVDGAFCSGNDVTKVVVERAYLRDARYQVTAEGTGASHTLTDVWVDWTIDAGSVAILQCDGSADIQIEGLRAYLGAPFQYLVRALDAASFSGNRNVVVDNGGTALRYTFAMSETSASAASWDGSVIAVSGDTANNNYNALMIDGWQADNNVYYQGALNKTKFLRGSGGTEYNGPTAYLTGVQPTQEANSVGTDPEVADASNGDFSLNGSGLPANCGVERTPTYLSIPETIAAAEAWILANTE